MMVIYLGSNIALTGMAAIFAFNATF